MEGRPTCRPFYVGALPRGRPLRNVGSELARGRSWTGPEMLNHRGTEHTEEAPELLTADIR
jgi:hypothetical protein